MSSAARLPNRKKRGLAARLPVTKNKKSKRPRQYHSSSEDEDEADAIEDRPLAKKQKQTIRIEENDDSKGGVQLPNLELDSSDAAEDSDSEDVDEGAGGDAEEEIGTSGTKSQRTVKKRNDPAAFAQSISKILDTKLTTTKRADPVLSRNKDAQQHAREFAETKLEARAKRKIKEEKKSALDRGRVKDVMGLNSTEVSTGAIAEHEKVLKKMAQRGVIKLFNAVRAAQVKVEEAERETQATGMVGLDRRQEKVNEMSKKGFLDMLAAGGVDK